MQSAAVRCSLCPKIGSKPLRFISDRISSVFVQVSPRLDSGAEVRPRSREFPEWFSLFPTCVADLEIVRHDGYTDMHDYIFTRGGAERLVESVAGVSVDASSAVRHGPTDDV